MWGASYLGVEPPNPNVNLPPLHYRGDCLDHRGGLLRGPIGPELASRGPRHRLLPRLPGSPAGLCLAAGDEEGRQGFGAQLRRSPSATDD